KAWSGKAEQSAAAQKAFYHRARMNHLAALGQWTKEQEQSCA
ncbi:MAG: fructose-bisphosphate aldolase, partial [Bartonella sp.]|nr:fructose-bisphosphate aldolase [Bartonella sp.]